MDDITLVSPDFTCGRDLGPGSIPISAGHCMGVFHMAWAEESCSHAECRGHVQLKHSTTQMRDSHPPAGHHKGEASTNGIDYRGAEVEIGSPPLHGRRGASLAC
jgi:hypothetical protein